MKVMLRSTKDLDFIVEGIELLAKNKEILILIYYHHGIGNRDFLLVKTRHRFKEIINDLNPSDELTIFKSPNILYRNIIDQKALKYVDEKIKKCKNGDWLVISETKNSKNEEWDFFDNIADLKSFLKGEKNKEVTIFCEPNWKIDKEFIRAYSPNKSGEINKGKY